MKHKSTIPPVLTAAIITKNAAETLAQTLESVKFADEIMIIDENSTDNTVDIALKFTDKILTSGSQSFSDKRNLALKNMSAGWILYVDSDEVIPPALAAEIIQAIGSHDEGVFRVTRENYFLDTKMYPDQVERLFHRDSLQGFRGKVHESPVTTGTLYSLKTPLIHHTHRDIGSMLKKTNDWSEMEADLRLNVNHPPVAAWRLIRIALTTWWRQFIGLHILTYGRSGLFEGYFQIVDKLIVYTKLWEKQQLRK